MGDIQLLRDKISESGYKLEYLANSIGVTVQSLTNKLSGKTEFKISEVTRLSKALKLTAKEQREIFLG